MTRRYRPLLHLMERTLTLLDRRNRQRLPARTPEQQSGIDGERAGYFHLRRLGYTVVARRWRQALLDGEVDLVAWEGETLCFVEVKTRSTAGAFAAEMQVDAAKQKALHRMADAYVRQLPWRASQVPSVRTRFDVVSVYLRPGQQPDVRLLRDAFR